MIQKAKYFIIIILFIAIASNAQTQLTVHCFAEGFYRPLTGQMVAVADPVNYPLICDTAVVALLNDTNYLTEYCTKVVVNTDGYGVCTIPAFLNGRTFIVGLKFRNTLHLYSITSIMINGQPVVVDLTVPQNCCGNPIVVQGFAMAASGEISSSTLGFGFYDGIIEAQDIGDMENSVYYQDSGYVITDLTGDGFVDSVDYFLEQKNVNFTYVDCYISDCSLISTNILKIEKEGFSIFPNPAVNNFNIRFNKSFSSLDIKLFNSSSQIVIERKTMNEQEVNIDCSRMEAGLYYFVIYNEEKHFTGKILLLNNR